MAMHSVSSLGFFQVQKLHKLKTNKVLLVLSLCRFRTKKKPEWRNEVIELLILYTV